MPHVVLRLFETTKNKFCELFALALLGFGAGFFHHLSCAFGKLPFYKGTVFVGGCDKGSIDEYAAAFEKGKVSGPTVTVTLFVSVSVCLDSDVEADTNVEHGLGGSKCGCHQRYGVCGR